MNLIETFKSPFKLSYENFDYNPDCMRVVYCTDEINDETTKEEIYIISKMYFDNLFSKYKSFHINSEPATESSYRLYVDLFEHDDVVQKHIYSMSYNNTEDKINVENKFDDNLTIEGIFSIVIDITAYRFDYDEIEDYDYYNEPEVKRTIKEEDCIICLENKPNVLYTECLHFAVCNSCDKKGNFSKCPLCRKKIMFYTQNVYILLFVILVIKKVFFLNAPYVERKLSLEEFIFPNFI